VNRGEGEVRSPRWGIQLTVVPAASMVRSRSKGGPIGETKSGAKGTAIDPGLNRDSVTVGIPSSGH